MVFTTHSTEREKKMNSPSTVMFALNHCCMSKDSGSGMWAVYACRGLGSGSGVDCSADIVESSHMARVTSQGTLDRL